MTEEEELAAVVQRIIDLCVHTAEVSPAWVATQAMVVIGFDRGLHRLGYAGCHLELRQIARAKLRGRFDPVEPKSDDIDDLFPETLQERYPRRPKRGEEPVYVLLHLLTDDDVAYNVKRMRRAAGALNRHADRLEAWNSARPIAA